MLLMTLQHNLDPTLKDLIESLLCDVEERLGSHGGAEEIKVSSQCTFIHTNSKSTLPLYFQ